MECVLKQDRYSCAKKPLICVVSGLITGILIARFLLGFQLSLFFLILFVSGFFILHKKSIAGQLLILSIVFAGSVRYHLSATVLPKDHLLQHQESSIYAVRGVIIKAIYRLTGRHQYVLVCDSARVDTQWFAVSGNVLLRTSGINQRYNEGTSLRIRGQPQKPPAMRNPGQFDYHDYLAGQDIYHLLDISNADSLQVIRQSSRWSFRNDMLGPVKDYFNQSFSTHLSEKDAALLRALLLGEKQDLDRAFISNFQRAGVVHVLAISGLHVGYIVVFVFTFLSFLRVSSQIRLTGLAVILIMYIVLVDFKAPVIRASLMVLLYLWAQSLERRVSTGNIIAGAACIILLFEPRHLFNPGFQFSFSAVISIIYGYKRLDRLIPLRKIMHLNRYLDNLLWTPLLVSAAAVIGTIPLTLYYYGTIQVIALLANLIVIPLVGCIVLLTFFVLIFSSFSLALADGTGLLIHWIVSVMSLATESFAALPIAAIIVNRPSLFFTLLITTGIIIVFFGKRENFGTILPVYMSGLLIWFIIQTIPAPPRLEAFFLDVGQGDAAFLRFPNQSTMLIDAGDATRNRDNGALTVLPFLQQAGATHLNYLVASHPHDDHIGGFPSIIQNIDIDTVVMSEYEFWSQNYKRVVDMCRQKNIPVRRVGKGDRLFPDPSCRVYIMHPDSSHARISAGSGAECNNSSLVIKVMYGKQSLLFTGDLEHDTEPYLQVYDEMMPSEILKVGHHGSKTSTSLPFLEKVRPLVAVIPVAKKNKFRHPSQITLDNLGRAGVGTYLTSTSGAVVFYLEPERIRLVRWRHN